VARVTYCAAISRLRSLTLSGFAPALACCLVVLGSTAASGAAQAYVGTARASPDVAGDYIVVLEDSVADPATLAREHAARFGLALTHVYEHAIEGYAATVPAARADALRSDPRVAFLAPVHALQTYAQTYPTGIDRVEGEVSSGVSGNGAGTIASPAVAIIDSGIQKNHRDLNVVGGVNCSGRGAAKQWDDYSGHGTHVAGIVGARDNDVGVVGVAPGVPLYAVRVTGGRNTTAEAVCGIDWVTKNAATIKVANMSLGYTTRFGWGGADDGDCGRKNNDAVHLAICRSVAAGVTYIAAAGNESTDFRATAPAAFDEVLTTTAMADFDGKPGGLGSPGCRIETDDAAAGFSNFTSEANTAPDADAAHTIAAPGVCIYSTDLNGGYSIKSGTSMASPMVAGAVALCLSARPDGTPGPCAALTPPQIIEKLRADAAAHASLTAGTPDYFGFAGDPTFPSATGYYGHLLYAGGY
jgi:subtilisin